jgi:hypothetical protein
MKKALRIGLIVLAVVVVVAVIALLAWNYGLIGQEKVEVYKPDTLADFDLDARFAPDGDVTVENIADYVSTKIPGEYRDGYQGVSGLAETDVVVLDYIENADGDVTPAPAPYDNLYIVEETTGYEITLHWQQLDDDMIDGAILGQDGEVGLYVALCSAIMQNSDVPLYCVQIQDARRTAPFGLNYDPFVITKEAFDATVADAAAE